MTGSLTIRSVDLPDRLRAQVDRPKVHAQGRRHFVGFREAEVASLLEGFRERVLGSPGLSTAEHVRLGPLVRVAEGSFIGGARDRSGFLTELSLVRGHGLAWLMAPDHGFRGGRDRTNPRSVLR